MIRPEEVVPGEAVVKSEACVPREKIGKAVDCAPNDFGRGPLKALLLRCKGFA